MLIKSTTPCHDAQEVLEGFEPHLPDCSGCKVSGLQHGATIQVYFIKYLLGMETAWSNIQEQQKNNRIIIVFIQLTWQCKPLA